jgi:orotidine-5'-phosphate decarboxylase
LRKAEKPFFEFNKAIIDATCDLVCCYKPQAAYYAAEDRDDELAMTIAYIKEKAPEVPVILDVKRGDIGSTAEQYAREAFERYAADAATVNPYMGYDAIKPFTDHAGKGVFVLCRTSNPSAVDLQNFIFEGAPLYEHVARLVRDKWCNDENAGLVIGATAPEELRRMREICPGLWFLVPGVGAQGGDVEKVVKNGCDAEGFGIAVNSSRGIIYASKGTDFAEAAAKAAAELRDSINSYRSL